MTPEDPGARLRVGESADRESLGSADVRALEQRVIAALRTVYDPEIPVNIYDLGLVYELTVQATGAVHIRMTLTAPGCPVAQTFPGKVEATVRSVPGVTDAEVELVWDPPWSRERMSEAARLELGML
jgi:FeS assembly SUF system protein